MQHKASIVEGSIENLGPNGIAFSVACCGDPKTIQRHTIGYAHTLTAQELRDIIQKNYLTPHAEAHAAAEKHAEHLKTLTESIKQEQSQKRI